jgi:hypothetical protein
MIVLPEPSVTKSELQKSRVWVTPTLYYTPWHTVVFITISKQMRILNNGCGPAGGRKLPGPPVCFGMLFW